MAITPELIHHHLTHLPQRRSLDGALELFDALGYQYADELPLLIRNWPTGIQRLLRSNAEPPIYLAQQRDFGVAYTHLATDHLSRTVERPIHVSFRASIAACPEHSRREPRNLRLQW